MLIFYNETISLFFIDNYSTVIYKKLYCASILQNNIYNKSIVNFVYICCYIIGFRHKV